MIVPRRADKTIKLWKVFEKSLKVVAENNGSAAAGNGPPSSPPAALTQPIPGLPSSTFPGSPSGSNGASSADGQAPVLRLPRMTYHDTIVAAVPRKVYANAHAYHINSISMNSDGETYMSADDLRINLWNLNISDQSFSTRELVFFRGVFTLTALPDRHSRHQACQHGGADRGHHGGRVPPGLVQPLLLLVVEGNGQARRHAGAGAVRQACKEWVLEVIGMRRAVRAARIERR